MARIGVRELKDQATEILRNVRENGAEYVITYHGRPVAVMMPLGEEWLEEEARRAIEAATPSQVGMFAVVDSIISLLRDK